MTYRALIQKLETEFAEHLDDDFTLVEPYDEDAAELGCSALHVDEGELKLYP
jgi:hypothetical protein